jgi:hypothetical protein
MRTILAGCVALSALAFSAAPPAKADIVVRTPGGAVERESPYWRHDYRDWQARREFRDREYRREAWVRDHCVRDWNGGEYCRR